MAKCSGKLTKVHLLLSSVCLFLPKIKDKSKDLHSTEETSMTGSFNARRILSIIDKVTGLYNEDLPRNPQPY